jgi:hypothetical protein
VRGLQLWNYLIAMNKVFASLTSGAVGAATLTAVHQTARALTPKTAPRMDVLGMRALSKIIRGVGRKPPEKNKLYTTTLAGDLLSNAAYYSLVGIGNPKGSLKRASILGLVAGLGAVYLPPVVGLGQKPVQRTTATKFMTVVWYTGGALASGYAMKLLTGKNEQTAASPQTAY